MSNPRRISVRKALCPCGSGKKYKLCCVRKGKPKEQWLALVQISAEAIGLKWLEESDIPGVLKLDEPWQGKVRAYITALCQQKDPPDETDELRDAAERYAYASLVAHCQPKSKANGCLEAIGGDSRSVEARTLWSAHMTLEYAGVPASIRMLTEDEAVEIAEFIKATKGDSREENRTG